MQRCTQKVTYETQYWRCACGAQGTSWSTAHTELQTQDELFVEALLSLLAVMAEGEEAAAQGAASS